MGTFSVPSKGERQFDFLIEEVVVGFVDYLLKLL